MTNPTPLEQKWLDSIEPKWLEIYRMTPEQRWERATKLRNEYLANGGTLEPDPDPQSPFWSAEEIEEFARAAQGGPPPPDATEAIMLAILKSCEKSK